MTVREPPGWPSVVSTTLRGGEDWEGSGSRSETLRDGIGAATRVWASPGEGCAWTGRFRTLPARQ